MLRAIQAILRKEFHEERRTRFVTWSVLSFTLSSLLVILFSMKAQTLDPTPRSALVWIVLLFAALTSGSRIFLQEQDRGTLPVLTLNASPLAIYLGKFAYTYLFLLLVSVITLSIYMFLMGFSIAGWVSFLATLLLGPMGLAGVTTMTSAMISQADRRSALLSVLSIPLLVPLILILVRTTRDAWVEGNLEVVQSDLVALLGFCGVVITMGVVLSEQLFNQE